MIENTVTFWIIIYLIWLPLSYILMKNWVKSLLETWEKGTRFITILSSILIIPMFIMAIMMGVGWIMAMEITDGWHDDASW